MDLLEKFLQNGYLIIDLPENSIIHQIIKLVENNKNSLNDVFDTSLFHQKLEKIQKSINLMGARECLMKDMKYILSLLLKDNSFAVQNVVYLRGVRPNNKKNIAVEYLPMHRENFYCDSYIDNQINVHFPVFNYNDLTAMTFIEKSHKFPDSKIILRKEDSKYSGVERFSKGHKLGLPYNPKIIKNIDEIGIPKRANCIPGQVMLFSTKLIHGGGSNESDEIRFSLDFGILPISLMNLQKKEHFAHYGNQNSHYSKLVV